MSILEWKVIYKMQHTLLIVIKCLNGYFFFKMIKAVSRLERLTWSKRWQFSIKLPSVVLWIVHTRVCIHTHTLAKLCFHSSIQSQPAAGKTSANYSLRAAFAAQCSMLFDTICLEFVNFFYRGFLSLFHSYHLLSTSIYIKQWFFLTIYMW